MLTGAIELDERPSVYIQNSVVCINSLRLHYFLSHSERNAY